MNILKQAFYNTIEILLGFESTCPKCLLVVKTKLTDNGAVKKFSELGGRLTYDLKCEKCLYTSRLPMKIVAIRDDNQKKLPQFG